MARFMVVLPLAGAGEMMARAKHEAMSNAAPGQEK